MNYFSRQKITKHFSCFSEQGRYAEYIELMGNNGPNNIAAELASALNTDKDFLQKLLHKHNAELSIAIAKRLYESGNGYQSAGYILLKKNAQQCFIDEIVEKTKKLLSIRNELANKNDKVLGIQSTLHIPLSSDAHHYINYLKDQHGVDVENKEKLDYLLRDYDINISIGKLDIESDFKIFLPTF